MIYIPQAIYRGGWVRNSYMTITIVDKEIRAHLEGRPSLDGAIMVYTKAGGSKTGTFLEYDPSTCVVSLSGPQHARGPTQRTVPESIDVADISKLLYSRN